MLGVSAQIETGSQFLVRLDVHIVIDRRVDRDGADIAEKGRVAVRRGACCDLGADDAGRANPIVDHDLLAEDLAHAGLQHAGDEIRSASRRERHDHDDRFIGIVAGILGAGCRAEQEQQSAAERRGDSGYNSLS